MPGRGLREGEPWRGEGRGPRGSRSSEDQEGNDRRPGFTARRARNGFPGGRKPPESSLSAVAFTGAGARSTTGEGTASREVELPGRRKTLKVGESQERHRA
jgi:hypothetical protein